MPGPKNGDFHQKSLQLRVPILSTPVYMIFAISPKMANLILAGKTFKNNIRSYQTRTNFLGTEQSDSEPQKSTCQLLRWRLDEKSTLCFPMPGNNWIFQGAELGILFFKRSSTIKQAC